MFKLDLSKVADSDRERDPSRDIGSLQATFVHNGETLSSHTFPLGHSIGDLKRYLELTHDFIINHITLFARGQPQDDVLSLVDRGFADGESVTFSIHRAPDVHDDAPLRQCDIVSQEGDGKEPADASFGSGRE